MQKILIIVGILIFPMCANAATVTAYNALYCDGSYSTAVERRFCEDATAACGSSGAVMPHVQSGGIYKSYQSCVRVWIGGEGSGYEYPHVLCFQDGMDCQVIDVGCHSNYYGTQPVISLSDMGSVGGLSYISNMAQFECCHNGGCTGWYEYGGTTQAGDMAIQARPNSCSTTGTCGSGGNHVICNIGYYSSKGLISNKVTGTGSMSNPAYCVAALGCTKCSTATGDDGATTDGYAKTEITQCILPTGHTDCDETGCFTYQSPCYYKE